MHNKIKYKHLTNPYVRDVFLSYLVKGARRTKPDGYPIIERDMVVEEPPKEVFQWDCRYEVTNAIETGMSFYCKDESFTPILNNPHRYIEKLSKYACVIGMDASPYDNMPLAVQKAMIYANLSITYFYGKTIGRIIPNVRLGNNDTIGMLDAIPHECLISVGTNGFVRNLKNRKIFRDQMSIVVDVLKPTGILVYGQDYDYIFEAAKKSDIPIYQYASHTMKRNAEVKSAKIAEGDQVER